MRLLNKAKMADGPYLSVPCKPDVQKFEIRGQYLLFDANSLALWDMEKEIYDAIDATTIGVSERPFLPGDLRDLPCKMLVLQTTYACNLHCRYCFVRHHYCTEENRLSLSDATRALEIYQSPLLFNGKYQGKLDVSFFGGEPLLNWELIKQVTEYQIERSKKYQVPWHCHITTNATLVTEEIAEYCAGHGFSFIVSLDGPAEIHDQNRPYHKGTGSHSDVLRGLKFLADAYHKKGVKSPQITLRATFDKVGLDLVAVLKYLNQLMYDGAAGHVSVEPSSLGEGCIGCAADQSRMETMRVEEIKSLFEKEYWAAADWFLAEIKAGRHPSFHHFEMPLARLYNREVSFNECGAGKGYLSVGPGGKLSACHRENSAEVGNLQDGVDMTRQARWLDNRYHVRETCQDCWMRNLCGGGCRHDSLQAGLPISVPVKIECLFKEMYTRPVLWLLSQMTKEQKEAYSGNPQGPQPRPQMQQQQQPRMLQPQSAQETVCALPKRGRQECEDPACPCHSKK